MRVTHPTPRQLDRLASELGLEIAPDEAETLHSYLGGFVEAYNEVGALPEHLPVAPYRRAPAYRPDPEDNPLNAWYFKADIEGAPDGPLAGRRVAVKDNVCVAGVPMMNGASILEGFVPETDATVVSRLLDAGAQVVGKAVCEYLSYSGGSATSSTGPVQNPRNPGYTTGGSSSGSAALVAAGEVDMAVGADQAGSVRIPAAYSGIVGLKPTFGLVPYTGVLSVDATIDHVGVLTDTVADNALYLEVLAGEDGLDSRQHGLTVTPYAAAAASDAAGLRIGVLREGFGRPESDPEVDEVVLAATRALAEAGCVVEDVSAPWHMHGPAIWAPICIQGSYNVMWLGGGVGTNREGVYVTALTKAFGDLRPRANELPPTLRIVGLLGHYAHSYFGTRFYAKAQNLRRQLRAAYDAALERYDVLVMPTSPVRVPKLPPPDATFDDLMAHSWGMTGNTIPFDLSGHPALSITAGRLGELPVGAMIVGRRFDEATVYRVAGAIERLGGS